MKESMKQLRDIIIGLEQEVISCLLIQKHSDMFVKRIMDKIELIIEYSGNLGKIVQQHNDGENLREYNLAVEKQKNDIKKLQKENRKLRKELAKYDSNYK